MSKRESLSNYGWQQRIRRLSLPDYLKSFLQAILDYKDRCPSNETLADHLGVSVRRVQQILKEAKRRELVFTNEREDRKGDMRRHFDLNKKKVRRLYRYRLKRRAAKRQKDVQAGLNKHYIKPIKTQFVPTPPKPQPIDRHLAGVGGEVKSQIVPPPRSFQPIKSRVQASKNEADFTQVDIDISTNIECNIGTKTEARREVDTQLPADTILEMEEGEQGEAIEETDECIPMPAKEVKEQSTPAPEPQLDDEGLPPGFMVVAPEGTDIYRVVASGRFLPGEFKTRADAVAFARAEGIAK